MRPFLTVSRQEIVELATPWDPDRIISEYIEERDTGATAVPTAAELAELSNGAILRFDLDQRFVTVEAELHLDVIESKQVGVDLAAVLHLRWWLWPVALPFRPRVRRWINARIDGMIDELREDVDTPSPTLPSRGREEVESPSGRREEVESPSGRREEVESSSRGRDEVESSSTGREEVETPAREREELQPNQDGGWQLKVLSPSGRTIYQRSQS